MCVCVCIYRMIDFRVTISSGRGCAPSNLPRGLQRFCFVNPFRAGGFSYVG